MQGDKIAYLNNRSAAKIIQISITYHSRGRRAKLSNKPLDTFANRWDKLVSFYSGRNSFNLPKSVTIGSAKLK